MNVIDIQQDRLDEAADVLAAAFADYPLMGYFFGGAGTDIAAQVRSILRFSCEYRILVGWPLLGALDGGSLVGVACVSPPDEPVEPPEVAQIEEALMAGVGSEALGRLEQYEGIKHSHTPTQPHHYLIALGVHPEAQGKGFGSALLERVNALARSHPQSQGVALDTEVAPNVAFYEHSGYEVIAEDSLGGVPLWFMYRRTLAV